MTRCRAEDHRYPQCAAVYHVLPSRSDVTGSFCPSSLSFGVDVEAQSCQMGKSKGCFRGCFPSCKRGTRNAALPSQKLSGSPASSEASTPSSTTPAPSGHREPPCSQAQRDSHLSHVTQAASNSPAAAEATQISISAQSSSTVVAPVFTNSNVSTVNINATITGDRSADSRTIGRRRLIPILKFCRKACLHHCSLTKFLLEPVHSILQSPNAVLTELDLGYNKLGDGGVKELCVSLKCSIGTLQALGLSDCNLTESCCEDLALLLLWQHSGLKNLELKGNDLGDTGVNQLCKALKSPICRLRRLG
ncbi:protein NLRC3-like [Arapaima gigas]